MKTLVTGGLGFETTLAAGFFGVAVLIVDLPVFGSIIGPE